MRAAAVIIAAACTATASAQIAVQNFDNQNDALPGSFNPAVNNLDGGAGDFWGVGSRNAWPQGFPSPGVPFSIADDSVFGYANGTPFTGDAEGIFGQNSDLDNDFFAISDSDEFMSSQIAIWKFDISTALKQLAVCIDFGSDIDDSFGYATGTFIKVEASIDGGAAQTLFYFTPGSHSFPSGHFRPMDSGTNEDPQNLLFATGDATITKHFADGGSSSAPGDLYLDKSVVATGALDTFETTVAGLGNELTLTLTANFPFEAAVLDNIVIKDIPSPSSLAALAIGGLVLMRRRRD